MIEDVEAAARLVEVTEGADTVSILLKELWAVGVDAGEDEENEGGA